MTRTHHAIGLDVTGLTIDAEATPMQLADDCHCLFTSAMSALEAMAEAAASDTSPPEVREPWWAMHYTMRAALAVFEQLYAVTTTARQQPVSEVAQ